MNTGTLNKYIPLNYMIRLMVVYFTSTFTIL